MRRLKQLMYILSIIGPIYDLLKGAYLGVKKGIEDITHGNTLEAERQAAEWEKANKG